MCDSVERYRLQGAFLRNDWPLGRFLATYLYRIAPPFFLPLDLFYLLNYVLTKLHLDLFWDTHAGAKLLCQALDLILTTAETRQKRRQRAWGDTAHRRFGQRDWVQQPIKADTLSRSAYVLRAQLAKERL